MSDLQINEAGQCSLEDYRRQAKEGNSFGAWYVASCFENGQGVRKSLHKAIKWYKRAYHNGSSAAALRIAELCREDDCCDETQAVSWLRKAAKLDNVDALYQLGDMYASGRISSTKRHRSESTKQKYKKKALPYFQRASELDHGPSLYRLGLCYRDGIWGVQQDFGEAAHLFEKAANVGCLPAMRELASAYSHGRGVPKDHSLARSWEKKYIRSIK